MYKYDQIVAPLLAWYDKNGRVLPWRSHPNPYYVWVSEIMLQQTRVEAVKAYFARFTEALPTIEDLAKAPEEELLKLWEGLGYYNRVRNLQAAAQTVMEMYDGKLPADFEALLQLKGIGSYTAGAIASISYGIPVPAVDGNVLRVMKRLSGSYDDILKASVKKQMEKDLLPVIPERAGAFNQAIMDLGAMVCIPNGKPLCQECPLAFCCIAREKGIQEQLPVKAKKSKRKQVKLTVLLLQYEDTFALQKRSEKGLLAGLWQFPNLEGHFTKKQVEQTLEQEVIFIKKLEPYVHIFTHIEWHMRGYWIRLQKPILPEGYTWVKKEDLQTSYALPTAFRRYLDFVREEPTGIK